MTINQTEKIVLATRNPNKADEIKKAFVSAGIKTPLITLDEAGFYGEIIEDGSSFKENALIKAKAACIATGLVSIADDSGLEVEFLGGRPGVLSARYGGESGGYDNKINLLLGELSGVPGNDRRARFVAVFCCYFPDGGYFFADGECEGIIAQKKAGAGNFGYDPVFYYPPSRKTFAQMSAEEKNKISHRGKAVEKLIKMFRLDK